MLRTLGTNTSSHNGCLRSENSTLYYEEGKVVLVDNPLFPLSFLYLCVFLISVFQLCRSYYSGNSIKHYHSLFHLFSALWALLRWGLFLFLGYFLAASFGMAKHSVVGSIFFGFLFDLPYVIQVATFSLLVIFFGEMVHRKTWYRTERIRFIWGYTMVNTMLFGVFVGFLIVDGISAQKDPCTFFQHVTHGVIEIIWLCFEFVLFTLLACLIGYYGWRVAKILRHDPSIGSQFSSGTTTSGFRILIFTTMIFVIYFARAIYVIYALYLVVKGAVASMLVASILFFCMEIIPLTIVLIFFRKIPTRPHEPFGQKEGGRFSEINSSSEEETSLLVNEDLSEYQQKCKSQVLSSL